MSFAAPLVLLALLALPLGAALYLSAERRARRAREAFVAGHLVAAVAPRRPRWRRHLPAALLAVAAAGLVVALARPQATVAVPVEQASVVVATDRSGSRLARDVAPSRLVAARRAAQALVDAVPEEVRVGALAFNHAPTVLASPTRDHATVREALGRVRPAGSTATGDALAAALRLVRPAGERPAPAAIVLLSDGTSVRGRDVLAVADEAARARVPVYTVALGTAAGTIEGRSPSGGTVTRRVPPDPATLREVARRTGGETFAIDDAQELERVFARLGSQVATEEQEREVTSWFAGGALLLLVGGVATSLGWFGRPV